MESKKGFFRGSGGFLARISSPIIGPSQPSVPRFLAGKAADNTDDAACIAGTVAGALHVRQVAKLYGVPVTWRARWRIPKKIEEWKLNMTQNVRERRYIFQSIILGIYVESSWWFQICFIFKPYLGKMNPFSQASFNWVETRWFKPCPFLGLVWFATFSGMKLSDLQFGESFQKVTNGRSWLYQLMVNN